MTCRHLRNIERSEARRVRTITFNPVANFDAWKIARFAPIPNLDRRDYVWPDAVETPTSGTETGQDGDEGAERGPEDATGLERGSWEISLAIWDIDIATAEALREDMSRVARSRGLSADGFVRPPGGRDRDIAEAVAHEREAIARRVESTGRAVLQAGLGAGEDAWRDCHVRGLELIDAARDIRAGAHNEGGE